ncbi:MAG: class II aldolase/adducin family protein [Alphaproteobacteria bacterium]|jgi:ribulose-5-phosphate 4-epimerase/fuculose-1-phosphate aldolase|nr:class II aldolase/adducin family protein [Alphaproteobacteria bacterium]
MASNQVPFDPAVGELFLRYARLVAGRGYIHNTLGNMAIRVRAPGFEHGVAYTKHAEVSLEEMSLDNIVITDIPTSEILYGEAMTSVGHNLNREILRLRPDIDATIHVHDDHTIALFASGGFNEVGVISADFPFIHGKPAYFLSADIDVESDARRIKDFIADTNCLVLLGHGVTTLGRSISEAYHRLTAFTSEVRRVIMAEQLAGLKGTRVQYRSQQQIEEMYRLAEQVIYPDRAEDVMR